MQYLISLLGSVQLLTLPFVLADPLGSGGLVFDALLAVTVVVLFDGLDVSDQFLQTFQRFAHFTSQPDDLLLSFEHSFGPFPG